MPIIKIYGFEQDNWQEAEKIRQPVADKLRARFGGEEAAIVLVWSDATTCQRHPENFQYLEILYPVSLDISPVIEDLKDLHLGLDVFLTPYPDKGYIPFNEME